MEINDYVRITKPDDTNEKPVWMRDMNKYDGTVAKVRIVQERWIYLENSEYSDIKNYAFSPQWLTKFQGQAAAELNVVAGEKVKHKDGRVLTVMSIEELMARNYIGDSLERNIYCYPEKDDGKRVLISNIRHFTKVTEEKKDMTIQETIKKVVEITNNWACEGDIPPSPKAERLAKILEDADFGCQQKAVEAIVTELLGEPVVKKIPQPPLGTMFRHQDKLYLCSLHYTGGDIEGTGVDGHQPVFTKKEFEEIKSATEEEIREYMLNTVILESIQRKINKEDK